MAPIKGSSGSVMSSQTVVNVLLALTAIAALALGIYATVKHNDSSLTREFRASALRVVPSTSESVYHNSKIELVLPQGYTVLQTSHIKYDQEHGIIKLDNLVIQTTTNTESLVIKINLLDGTTGGNWIANMATGLNEVYFYRTTQPEIKDSCGNVTNPPLTFNDQRAFRLTDSSWLTGNFEGTAPNFEIKPSYCGSMVNGTEFTYIQVSNLFLQKS